MYVLLMEDHLTLQLKDITTLKITCLMCFGGIGGQTVRSSWRRTGCRDTPREFQSCCYSFDLVFEPLSDDHNLSDLVNFDLSSL